MGELEQKLAEAGVLLGVKRRAAAGKLRAAVETCLADLAMAGSRFDVRISWQAAHKVRLASYVACITASFWRMRVTGKIATHSCERFAQSGSDWRLGRVLTMESNCLPAFYLLVPDWDGVREVEADIWR